METTIKSKEQLQGIVSFLIWQFDANQEKVLDKIYKIEIIDWTVKISYVSETIEGEPARDITDYETFPITHNMSFSKIEKRVFDACEAISKIKLEA